MNLDQAAIEMLYERIEDVKFPENDNIGQQAQADALIRLYAVGERIVTLEFGQSLGVKVPTAAKLLRNAMQRGLVAERGAEWEREG